MLTSKKSFKKRKRLVCTVTRTLPVMAWLTVCCGGLGHCRCSHFAFEQLSLIMEAQVVWMMTSALFWEARSPVTGRRLYQTLPHPHSVRQWRTYLVFLFINSRLDCNKCLSSSSVSVLAPLFTVINNAQCESPTCRVIILKSSLLAAFLARTV